jgi:hypothetical protein
MRAPARPAECLYLSQEPARTDVQVDRYGWEIDPSRPEPTKEERQKLEAESAKERERELKWVQMLGPELDPRTQQPSSRFREFRKSQPAIFERRVLKGIPDACRSRVWYELLDSKSEVSKERPTVQRLFDRGIPPCDHVIQVDIPRTMPHVTMFSQNSVRESLYRLLRAYSNSDRELGYFQGMAFSAALLLSYMNETRAFWAFWQLMHGNKHEVRFFYMNDFSRLKEVNKVWEALLKKKFPKVAEHLKALPVEPMLYTPGWFLTGFQTMQFPPPFRLRMFDRQIAFGTRALLSFALTIVSISKKQLETKGPEVCIPLLQNPTADKAFKDWRAVIKKFDANFLSKSEYAGAFKAAGLKEFP